MTQQVIHARVIMHSTDAHTDDCSNDFYFEATGSDPNIEWGAPITPQTKLIDFYNTATVSMAGPLASYISPKMDRSTNGTQILFYDVTAHLGGSPAGAPIRTANFTLATSAASSYLPPGCSACMGYRGDYASDVEHVGGTRPRARDRGRIFLGPLTSAANGGAGGVLVTPFKDDYALAFDSLAQTQNSGLASQFNLVQWSRRNATIKAVRWYALNEGVSYTRLRADENINRVHNWVAV